MSTTETKTYWRSLNELAKNEEYQRFVDREFPEGASEFNDGYSRRNFLQIMGASIALAGLAACRKPVQKILPLTRQPEYTVEGKPVLYASAMPFLGSLTGIVVETNSGRPTKIEGNELHPGSLGGTHIHQQAAILDLYDPDRARGITQGGEARTADDFAVFAGQYFTADKRVAVLSASDSSITLNRLKADFKRKFARATWVTYDAFGEENALLGTQMAFGRKLRAVPELAEARVIVSLDDDFMSSGADSVRRVKAYSAGRRVMATTDTMNRLYVVESNYSLTGTNAEHRIRVKTSEIPLFTFALAAELGVAGFAGYSNSWSGHAELKTLAADLAAHRGASVVTVGDEQPAAVHAAAAGINAVLGNAGRTVRYVELPHAEAGDQHAAFTQLKADLSAGGYDALVILGANPAHTAPGFAEVLGKVPTVVHLSTHEDETTKALPAGGWHVPMAHFLESWGDGTSFTGVRSVVQPMIQPLFGGWSAIEVLGTIVGGAKATGYDLVRATWTGGDWRRILHDGFLEGTAFASASTSFSGGAVRTTADAYVPVAGLELSVRRSPHLLDGSVANNGWLQELPDAITKITWDNVLLVSPTTARALFGLEYPRSQTVRPPDSEEPVARITVGEESLNLPIWVVAGHADDALTVYAGYGRTHSGRIGNGTGVDTYPLRNGLAVSATVRLTEHTYPVASTQDHHSMEGRPLIREATLATYAVNPRFAADMVKVPGPKVDGAPISLFNEQVFPAGEPQWGMTIDLTSCIGCGVCTIACQAENNIPVVGKKEVKRGREMHWIRVDRYFSGDLNGSPQVVHQPIPCMNCELAPCEQVCPVAATTHSDDGLNQMTYNRCIGTRYCANNCPFKVRRFNFFNYPKLWLEEVNTPEVVQMAMNPDVSVRFRGVMEKCTYCVQRISRAKIEAKRTTDSKKPADGAVKTACQQACPSDAIYFGDISQSDSRITQVKTNDRNYLLLEELNIRPRTSYLAKLRNPNEATA